MIQICLEEKLKTRLTYRWRSVSQHFVYLDSCAVEGLITDVMRT